MTILSCIKTELKVFSKTKEFFNTQPFDAFKATLYSNTALFPLKPCPFYEGTWVGDGISKSSQLLQKQLLD